MATDHYAAAMSKLDTNRQIRHGERPDRLQAFATEALVHAVLHLAAVVEAQAHD